MININQYQVTVFDPGAVATGWARFSVDFRAFSRPENKLLRWVDDWDCGEIRGPEHEMLSQCVSRIGLMLSDNGGVPYLQAQVVSEDFELTQLIGGQNNLLSPVRINAVLQWECTNRAIKFALQRRNMRTSVTPERLKLFGFKPRHGKRWTTSSKGKDEFAAMQHAIVWLRRLKAESKTHPWRLMEPDGGQYWDCDCSEGKKCDMIHP